MHGCCHGRAISILEGLLVQRALRAVLAQQDPQGKTCQMVVVKTYILSHGESIGLKHTSIHLQPCP